MILDLSQPPTLDEICGRAVRLPSAPAILPQLLACLCRPEGDTGEIEALICQDSALAAATLRLGNSAAYGARKQMQSIEQAVIFLGYRELYRLASLSLVSRWEDVHRETLPWAPGEYSRHSFCMAIATEVLAESSGHLEAGVAYTAGLVCDLGKLVLAFTCPEYYPRIADRARRPGWTWSAAERSVLGFDQAELGGRLMRAWRFPEYFAQAVEFQLTPAAAPAEIAPLVSQLHAARYLTFSLGSGTTEGGFSFIPDRAYLAAQGFTLEALQRATLEVRTRALHRLAQQLRPGG
jgi:HD-like signal output (HDOD) protein